ncbi:SDR family NAD(P)-dependent oxidoreductase [Nakamurella lactea]|uniref:SDR family NAD(P)-dependent oxidoreductase n=1 Tax=Nakamurella lactea TaxID=459515 RepID=UPI00048C159B|nr:SDR family NAD(P)-dependent oxidoreductase [Nakamurella lactea]
MSRPARESVILVTGATGDAGRAACRALAAAGHQVVAVGRSGAAPAELTGDRVQFRACDLTDVEAVGDLGLAVRGEFGLIDGLVHLVGGWRGGRTFEANTDDDWDVLSSSLIQTLRHVTLEVHDDLLASDAGRAVIVSSTAVTNPTAGNANYATAKAAAETWMLALADSFRRNQSGRSQEPLPQTAAAVILAVKAIGDKPGFTTADALAGKIVEVFAGSADELNGSRIDLTAGL